MMGTFVFEGLTKFHFIKAGKIGIKHKVELGIFQEVLRKGLKY